MNITYQPTGVYKQFVKNPELLNSSENARFGNNNQPENNQIKNNNSRKKEIALKIALGAAGVVALCGIVYYKKGLDTINLPKKMPEVAETDEKFADYLRQNMFEPNYEDKLIALREKYTKYSNNWVGKTHDFFNKVRQFFKDNFYGY